MWLHTTMHAIGTRQGNFVTSANRVFLQTVLLIEKESAGKGSMLLHSSMSAQPLTALEVLRRFSRARSEAEGTSCFAQLEKQQQLTTFLKQTVGLAW